MMSDHDKANVSEILNGYGDWFTARLLRVIAHSDNSNRELLYRGFPVEVNAVNEYQHGKPFTQTVAVKNEAGGYDSEPTGPWAAQDDYI